MTVNLFDFHTFIVRALLNFLWDITVMSLWGPVAGFVASELVGMVWYSSVLFGDSWMRMVHPRKRPEELKSSSGRAMVVSMVAHAALAGILRHVYVNHMLIDNLPMAMAAGLSISTVCAISEICHVMFGKKSWALFAIDNGFNTAVILTMSVGIGLFL